MCAERKLKFCCVTKAHASPIAIVADTNTSGSHGRRVERTKSCCEGSTNSSLFHGFFYLLSQSFSWSAMDLSNGRCRRAQLTSFSLKFSFSCQHNSSILSRELVFSSSSSSSSSHPESLGHSQHSPSEGDPLELELDPGSVPESSSPPERHFLSDFTSRRRFLFQRRGSSRISTSSSSLSTSSSFTRFEQVRAEEATEDERTIGFDWSICTSTESVFLFRLSIFVEFVICPFSTNF
jgi:hypothetical protein